MRNRHIRILEILSRNIYAEIIILTKLLDVSPVTMRRDLDILEKKGFILREQGYACINNLDDFDINCE
jgi:DeoR/GlpR family transcriptional regulator of sugar metabolism